MIENANATKDVCDHLLRSPSSAHVTADESQPRDTAVFLSLPESDSRVLHGGGDPRDSDAPAAQVSQAPRGQETVGAGLEKGFASSAPMSHVPIISPLIWLRLACPGLG